MEQVQKTHQPHSERPSAPAEAAPHHDEEAERLKAETDALLDEIDEVLVENAEAFVASYVQKGGE